MKKFFSECFHFHPTKDTLVAFISALTVLGLSLAMLLFPKNTLIDETCSFLLRDVLMIVVVGFWLVLHYVVDRKKATIALIGFRRDKLTLSLVLNVVFAVGLLCIFLKEGGDLQFSYGTVCAVVYIFAAGISEMFFIYGFLRHFFEEAFGAVPAVLLTAVFYSFHHAGFQPEFLELFFVGILYASVIYITKNILIIFPFFWGVGATWDVLVDSTAGNELRNTTSLVIAIGVLVSMVVIGIIYKKKVERSKSQELMEKISV